jgi:hypothetical protein
MQLPAGDITNHGIQPAGQLHQQAAGLAAVELGRALDGLGKSEPVARRGDRDGIADFRTDTHDVRHEKVLLCRSDGRLRPCDGFCPGRDLAVVLHSKWMASVDPQCYMT